MPGSAASFAGKERFGKTKASCNARMSSRQIKEHCHLDEGSQELPRVAISDLHFSARAYDRILKVARTIADLAGRKKIETEDVSEAIQYRTPDRNLWVYVLKIVVKFQESAPFPLPLQQDRGRLTARRGPHGWA